MLKVLKKFFIIVLDSLTIVYVLYMLAIILIFWPVLTGVAPINYLA
ncbi:MAG: hypothetical protein ACRC41_13395 [Sarcina sp.]